MSSFTPLEQSILRTLAYYDLHAYPLTAKEIRRWLVAVPDLQPTNIQVPEIEQAIAGQTLAAHIEREDDRFFLTGRRELVALRKQRLEADLKKWRRAVTVAQYLEIVPFIKMVAVVNTLAINNAKPESDIDLLIVTSPGHIWIARMMVTGIVSMLGYRRDKQHITDRVCLSFYLSSAALNLEPLKRENEDHHFAFWATQAVPLLDDGTYERFVQANTWITNRLPNAWEWDWKERLVPRNQSFRSIKNVFGAFLTSPIGAWMEGWARTRQLKRFEKNVESKAREATTDVVISEDVLKFHEADRRLDYNRQYAERLRQLGLTP